MSIVNNIMNATLATPGNNGIASDHVLGAVVGANSSVAASYVSVTGNYIFNSDPGTVTTAGSPNTAAYISGTLQSGWPFGTNTYNRPGFANPSALPTTQPNCSGYRNTTDCMNSGYGVYAALTPSGGAAGMGYKPPGSCAADNYYPAWLKGMVYLSWNGSVLTENSGLVNKPCGL